MDNPSPYNMLSLCAGVGGLELGVRIARSDARLVCAVEIEAHAAEVLAARMEDGTIDPAPVWSDVATFDGGPWRGVVDCVVSGDPCQPNSVAGAMLGADDDRWLLDKILAIVEAVRPARFFRENVTGNADGQLAYIVPALERMGYRVAAGIFSAEEVGFSHRRERLFIMADRGGERPQEREQSGQSGQSKRGVEARSTTDELCGASMGDPASARREDGKSVEGRSVRNTGGGKKSRGRRNDVGNPDRSPDQRKATGQVGGSVGRTAADGSGAGGFGKNMADPANGESQEQEGDDRIDGERSSVGRGEQQPARLGTGSGDFSRPDTARDGWDNASAGDIENDLGNVDDTDTRHRQEREISAGGNSAFDASRGLSALGNLADNISDGRDPRWEASAPDDGGRGEEGFSKGDQSEPRDLSWLPLAAPGPSDPRWRDIIAHAPHLEPAVRRVDARLAYRIDRLRECGNGVSSLAASFAWRTLESMLHSTD